MKIRSKLLKCVYFRKEVRTKYSTHFIYFTLFVKYDVLFCTSAYFYIERISNLSLSRMKICYSSDSH